MKVVIISLILSGSICSLLDGLYKKKVKIIMINLALITLCMCSLGSILQSAGII